MRILTNIKQNYWLVAILFLAAFLRLYHIDFQSIWLDEIHTMIESDPGLTLREFDRVMMVREGMGHLYFLSLRFLYAIFGYTTLTARVFSAIIGIGCVYGIYLLGKVLYNKRVGLIAALLLSINIFHITYSQEARPYVLLVFFTIISFYRLVLYIKKPSLKNALLFGLFAGLIINAHFVGLITVFAQFLLLLFILLITPKEEKSTFFKLSFYSGITAFLVMLPTYRLFFKMSKYHSGWLTLPGPDGFTIIFKQFLGNTEMLVFVFSLLFIFYFINLFKQKETGLSLKKIKNNRLIFSAILFFTWIFLSIPLSIIKSYLDEPMILSRYFIHLLPALMLILAIAIDLIKNKIAKVLLILLVVIFSLVDIFIVKNYYHAISKTQFREITAEIAKKNTGSEKIISTYGWLMGYFLNEKNNNPVLEMSFENYIQSMRNKSRPMDAFWFMNGNFLPYALGPEDEKFLNENFILKEKIEKFDTWARFYVPKVPPVFNGDVFLNKFLPLIQDENGALLFFENSSSVSSKIRLKKGKYNLVINGSSTPEKPINGENAHLIIKYGGKKIADFYLSEDGNKKENILPFEIATDKREKMEIIFDNDISVNGQDRNAIIHSMKILKRE